MRTVRIHRRKFDAKRLRLAKPVRAVLALGVAWGVSRIRDRVFDGVKPICQIRMRVPELGIQGVTTAGIGLELAQGTSEIAGAAMRAGEGIRLALEAALLGGE